MIRSYMFDTSIKRYMFLVNLQKHSSWDQKSRKKNTLFNESRPHFYYLNMWYVFSYMRKDQISLSKQNAY